MTTTVVSLPELPTGLEFEEFISAFLQVGGLYIERNVIDRGAEEVLELDVITTDYDSSPPEIKLLEMKAGKWGFSEIFKLRGWLDYLNFQSALLVVRKGRTNIDFVRNKAKTLNIDIAVIDDLSKAESALNDFYAISGVDKRDVNYWRFSYWLERKLLARLTHKKKSGTAKCHRALEKDYYDISSGIFFTENIVERGEKLYEVYQRNPRISAKCANEMSGGSFDDPADNLPKKIYQETYYGCKYNDIQISTFVEHRARLSLLKSAVDYILYERAGITGKVKRHIKFIGGKELEIPSLTFLPSSFISGLKKISKHKYFHRYPIFWQWFLWFFGGFILLDFEQEEYKLMSEKTGIPVEEIPNALSVYDIMFPLNSSWFMDLNPNTNIKLLRMHSVPFMGVGANVRRLYYTSSYEFDDLSLSKKYTKSNLVNWNNLFVEVLSTH